MRVALIGVGGMGSLHLDIYKGMADVELVALCDIRMDMLKEKAGDLPVRLYDDIDALLTNETLDMVDICTPTYLHAEQAIKAMEAGVHVLSEKPMARTYEECKAINAVIAKTGKHYMTAQVVRFMNAYRYLRGVITSDKYGKLESLTLQRYSQAPLWSWENWFLDEARSGHVALDLMIHDIDFMQSVLGEPETIVGVYRPMAENMTNYAYANYIYKDCVASVETGWYTDQTLAFCALYKAVFARGNVVLEKDGCVYDCGKPIDFDEAEVIGETDINISDMDGYAGEIRYFIDCIRPGCQATVATSESTSKSVALVERTLHALTRI